MAFYPLTPEQLALYAVARTTWDRRGKAKATGLPFGEETVTDLILMDLQLSFPGPLTIIPFSKPEEGKRGADWAWLFRDASGNHNLPMLVQAKALDLADVNYPEIKRNIGKKKPPVRQIDRLIETAEALGWPPIYVFYNHLSDVSRIPNACGSLPASSPFGAIPESWGISFADAYMVRKALNDQTFDTHRAHSQPLHCLLCSNMHGVRPPGGSPELAMKALGRIARSRDPKGGLGHREDSRREPTIYSQPPDLFQRALEITQEQNLEQRDERIATLARKYPDLAGVVFLQDAEATPRRS